MKGKRIAWLKQKKTSEHQSELWRYILNSETQSVVCGLNLNKLIVVIVMKINSVCAVDTNVFYVNNGITLMNMRFFSMQCRCHCCSGHFWSIGLRIQFEFTSIHSISTFRFEIISN